MSDSKTPDAYNEAHAGHAHDTFVITADDMKDADRLQHLLSRASERTQSSSGRVDRAAARLGEAMASHDQVEVRARQLEYDVTTAVFDGWLSHQDRLLRQLGQLDMLNSTAAANTHSAAMVRWTKVLAAATVVLSAATSSSSGQPSPPEREHSRTTT